MRKLNIKGKKWVWWSTYRWIRGIGWTKLAEVVRVKRGPVTEHRAHCKCRFLHPNLISRATTRQTDTEKERKRAHELNATHDSRLSLALQVSMIFPYIAPLSFHILARFGPNPFYFANCIYYVFPMHTCKTKGKLLCNQYSKFIYF